MMNVLHGSALSHRSRVCPAVLLLTMTLCALASGALADNALGIPDSEYNALVGLYNATDGPNWTNNTNWLTENTPWNGVTVENGHVAEINLYSNRLSGAIPSEIGDLPNLNKLSLSSNQLTGPIPAEIGNLSNLQEIYLQGNQLTGSIPATIASISFLSTLYLSENQLCGTIPAELGNLPYLVSLGLGSNQLTGTIPTELASLPYLQVLDLSDNRLSGTIPSELGNLTHLAYLELASNLLTGEIPSSITNLVDLYANLFSGIRFNALHSSDPSVIAFLAEKMPGWENTQTLAPTNVSAAPGVPGWAHVTWTPIHYVSGDGYYEVGVSCTPGGPYEFLPHRRTGDKFADGLDVALLDVGTYYLVVRTVSLAGQRNQSDLTSSLSDEVQVEITEAGNLLAIPQSEYDALVALYNATDGPNWTNNTHWITPNTPWHGVTIESGHVVQIDLFGNGLSGTIPPDIGDLSNVEMLNLGSNQLTGVIPSQIGDLSSLMVLGLYYNQLTGEIPAEIGNLSGLQALVLSFNQLTGPMPPQIGNLSNLMWLGLDDNQFSGSIPAEIGNLSSLQLLWLQANQLTGPIPSTLTNLTLLEPSSSSISHNALWSADPVVLAFLGQKAPDWENTQTVTPTNFSARIVQPGCVEVSWVPILYRQDEGCYEVGVSTTPGGPYTFSDRNRARNKSMSSTLLVDAPTSSSLYLTVRAVTLAGAHNQSTLTSPLSPEISTSDPGHAMRISEAKRLGDGEPVTISNVPATMGWLETENFIKAYIQEWDRSSGIAIRIPADVSPGDVDVSALSLTGTMATQDGERYINVSTIYYAYGEEPDLRPLGINSLAGYRGVDICGLGIATWGKVIESPTYNSGMHPDSFRMMDASMGEFTLLCPRDHGEFDDNRLLMPMTDTFLAVRGVCSGTSGEKILYLDPEYEVDALCSHRNGTWFGGFAGIEDNRHQTTAMAISGPGIDGWQPMQSEEGDDDELYWRYSWTMPDPLSATPAEYLFKISKGDDESIYRGWITRHMTEMPTNLRPADDGHVSGQLVFSWTLPSAGRPYTSTIHFSTYGAGYDDVAVLEAGYGSSYFYSESSLEPGRYSWWLHTFDRDGNSCRVDGGSFYYDM